MKKVLYLLILGLSEVSRRSAYALSALFACMLVLCQLPAILCLQCSRAPSHTHSDAHSAFRCKATSIEWVHAPGPHTHSREKYCGHFVRSTQTPSSLYLRCMLIYLRTRSSVRAPRKQSKVIKIDEKILYGLRNIASDSRMKIIIIKFRLK